MKRIFIGLLAVGLVVALTLPAAAFDNEFGGYWRTRFYTQKDFSGNDKGTQDYSAVDTRTRLFYTAVFSEDFKFVNQFEFNVTWGDVNNGGGIATDGTNIFRIKNSYANFNLGDFNFLVGLQYRVLNRGFLFDDDFAGAAVTYKGGTFQIPFIWMKAYEGGYGKDKNDNDVDYYVLKPTFNFGNIALTPTVAYIYSKDASKWPQTTGNKSVEVYFAGADVDARFGGGSALWFTGIYEGGSADLLTGGSVDVKAYLVALGGTFQMGPFDVHGQAFWASGDDRTTNDFEAFFVPKGQMYYWAEIMGYGLTDNQASANSPADKISNIKAFNVGVGYKATDKLSFKADVWHARLNEDTATAKSGALGTEIDLRMTYELVRNLKLDLVGAYLFAGSATYDGTGDENPWEAVAQLSFSF
jgi:hypothetical protein